MLDIAVVGIGCRFPGSVDTASSFWRFLLEKGDGIREVPADRWSLDRFYDPDPDKPGRMYTKSGGFVTQSLWDFDPEYFGISPREASIMDPQQRLLLEVAVEALDDAGLAARVGGRNVGVYVGGFMSDNMALRHSRVSRNAINSHTPTSGTFTMLSNRLSYVFDLHGPSMTIDTACSSSLVALHEAAQAVARGECELALVGGVNAMLQPETFVSMCKGRFLAPDGHCKTFDAAADGYARGEGAGVVVLKPLAAAEADGDRVYAVLKATGANQDGRTSGITVPNPVAQAALATRVLAESGLRGADIGYVEAHGTGTSIGDPLEISALGQVYGQVEGRHTPLVVGSVKASIGHLEAAAGVASVIKAALTVHHGVIAPQAWLNELNPAIPFSENRIEIPTEVAPFPAGYRQAAVAVNGFGYGGTNAHAILAAAPPAPPAPVVVTGKSSLQVFPVSGRTEAALREAAGALAPLVDAADDGGTDVQTLQAAAWGRRLHHPIRTAFVWNDGPDLAAQLRAFAAGEGRSSARVVAAEASRPVFVFSGMGPQWWRMGRDLLECDGVFAATAREIDAEFIGIAGWSIIEALLADEADSRVTRTEVAQPANFLLQVSLTAELAALGITPAAILGHSVGEVSAAYVSGALSLHDALMVSYHRARLQATTAGSGSMLAVGLPGDEALTWLGNDGLISVAAVNSPSSVTLAGDTAALDTLGERFAAEGVFSRPLQVEVPYHSYLMDPILADIKTVLGGLVPRRPTLPLYSSVTSGQVIDDGWGAAYWVDNVRQPVRFAAAIEAMVADGHRVFLEVGPHPVLGGNIREVLVRGGEPGAVVSTLVRNQNDVENVGRCVASLYAAGSLDTSREPGSTGPIPRADLPFYPWQRTRLWTEVESSSKDRLGTVGVLPMLGERTESYAPEWELDLAVAALPWLPDHVVDGLVLLPGAAYLDAALSAASTLTSRDVLALEDVRFLAARIIDDHDVPVLRLSVEPGTQRFSIDSRSANDTTWGLNVTGRIVDGTFVPGPHRLSRPANARHVSGAELYQQLEARGLQYGPAFRGILDAWVGPTQVVARVDATTQFTTMHVAHPATVDAALQCVAALVAGGQDAPSGPVVPAGVKAVRRFGPLSDEVTVSVERLDRDGLWADIILADTAGTVALELLGVEFRPVRPAGSVLAQLDRLWYEQEWERFGQVIDTPVPPSAQQDEVVIVAFGDQPSTTATALLAGHAGAQLVTLALNADDVLAAGGADAVARAVRAATMQAASAITVVVVAPAEDVSGVDATAGVLAAAGAVQTVLATLRSDLGDAAEEIGGVDIRGAVVRGAVVRGVVVRGVVVTEQAFGIPGDLDQVRLGHAALVGVRRTLRNEQPDLAWRLIDIEAATTTDELAAEIFIPREEETESDEVALRGGLRLVTRLRRNLAGHLAPLQSATPLDDPEASFRVEAPTTLLSDLCLRQVERVAPGVGQVEVRILSAGLNYKDSAKVIGLLTERELAGTYFGTTLGMEALGVVVRVGSGVTDYHVGDRLALGMRDVLARYATLDTDQGGAMSLAPSSLADTDSALILPFLTAHHSLLDVARVQPGETVLIQGAAGGVGLAAIQVAKRAGATVIGTASTPQRRQAVLDAGADAVLDSRSLNFVEDVRGLTGGLGVDVVLNSAPGEVISANLDVAAEFGRVVEIGKADIYGGGVLPLAPFDRNLSFLAVDIDRMFAFRRAAIVVLAATIHAAFESGHYVPLPTTVYPLSQLQEAFEAVARGTHIGRVVLEFSDPAPLVRPAVPAVRVRADATYLITGGFGAFGLATANWLAREGARHLVLVGRRGASTPEARAQVDALIGSGIEIIEASVDIASAEQVGVLMDTLLTSQAPLRGVFHAAGVLDDRPFTDIDAESLRTVMRPKVDGAVNLHEATTSRAVDLEYFVVYSSAAAINGNVPQTSYNAANTTLDSLVRIRRAGGQHGLTVNWGALSGGMAESSEEVERYLATIGMPPLDMDLAARTLGEALALDVTQVGILDIIWPRWGATHPMSAGTPRFAEHIAAASASDSDSAQLQAELLKLPGSQQVEVVAYMLAEQLAAVLGIPAETIDLDTALPDLGMDSLMAVEMQARVNMALAIEVSALEFIRGGGLAMLATRIMPQLIGSDDAAERRPVAVA